MFKYKKHVFVCENIREDESVKPSCARHGGSEILQEFKKRLNELGLSKTIRPNSAGCFGACKHGPVAIVYPQGTWYGNLTVDNVEQIIQSDLINDKVVEELELKDVEKI